MRREIVAQLVLTALALLLLLFVIFTYDPIYVEELPEGVSSRVAVEMGKAPRSGPGAVRGVETLYGPDGAETTYLP